MMYDVSGHRYWREKCEGYDSYGRLSGHLL